MAANKVLPKSPQNEGVDPLTTGKTLHGRPEVVAEETQTVADEPQTTESTTSSR